jgi:hypothetical protein
MKARLRGVLNFFFASSRYEVLAVVAVTFIGFSVLFPKVIFQGEVIGPVSLIYNHPPWSMNNPNQVKSDPYTLSDQIDKALPELMYMSQRIKEGVWPFYTDRIQNGAPLFWVIKNEIKVIPLLLLLLIFPFSTGMTVYLLLRALIGAIFLHKFLRVNGVRHFPSLIASQVFIFSSFMIQKFNMLIGFEYLMIPVCLYAIERIIRSTSKFWLVLLPIIMSQIFLAGYPTIAAYILTFLMLYATYISITEKRGWKERLKYLTIFGFVSISSLCLSSPGLLASMDFFSDFDWGYRKNYWKMHVPRHFLATYFFPFFYGGQHQSTWIRLAVYVGTLPLIFASLTFWIRSNRIYFFLGMAVIVYSFTYDLLGALTVYQYIPAFNKSMSNNMVSMIPPVLSILSGFGVNHLLSSKRSRRLRMVFLASVFWVLSLVIVLYSFGPPPVGWVNKAMLVQYCIFFFSFVVLFFCVVRPMSPFTKGLCCLIIFVDLFWMGVGFNPTIKREDYYRKPPVVDFLKENIGWNKIFMVDNAFLANGPQFYDLITVSGRGFYSRRSKRLYQLIDQRAFKKAATQYLFPSDSQTRIGSQLVDALGIKYVIARPNNDPAVMERGFAYRMDEFNSSVELKKGADIVQTFSVQEDFAIDSVSVRLAKAPIKDPTSLILTVEHDGQVVKEVGKRLGRDAVARQQFDLGKLQLSAGKEYLVRLFTSDEEVNLSFNAVISSKRDYYRLGSLMVGGKQLGGDLTMQAVGRNLPAQFSVDKFKKIYDKDVAVWENTEVFPRAWLVSNVKVMPEEDIYQGMSQNELDLRETAYFADTFNNGLSQFKFVPSSSGSLVILTLNEEVQSFELSNIDEDQILVIGDNYDPNWIPYVDGKKVKLYEVDFHLRAVVIPKGSESVDIRYRPPYSLHSIFLVIFGFLIIVGLVLVTRPISKTQKPEVAG